MHNYPGMPVGSIRHPSGPDHGGGRSSTHRDRGRGAHAARPHLGDRYRCWWGRRSSTQCQSIVSRNVDPLEVGAWFRSAMFRAGNADNVHPADRAVARHGSQSHAGGARSSGEAARDSLKTPRQRDGASYANLPSRLPSAGQPCANRRSLPPAVAGQIAGERPASRRDLPPMMGAEDFSYMLNARPGAFIWVGNGDSAGLHHPAYNFNDDTIPFGTSYWVKLVETALAA